MVLKFLYGLWNGEGVWSGSYGAPSSALSAGPEEVISGDPLDPIPGWKKEQLRQEQANLDLQVRDKLEEKNQRKKDEDTEQFMRMTLAAREYERMCRDLSDNVADAIKASRLAYERAQREEGRAREALQQIQRNALVLSDGRRVYFTRDGRALYDEDRREITDRPAVEGARRLRRAKPDAPDYEMFVTRQDELAAASHRSQLLAETLQKLDEINEELKTGAPDPERLERNSREVQELINALPADVQEDYERIHAARQTGGGIAYRVADASFNSGPDLSAHFDVASAPTGAEPKAPSEKQERAPAYRAAPEF